MQLDSSEAQVSFLDIGKPFDGKSFEEVDEYKETIYKALGVAFSNIFDITKEIEKTNRIIASFHNEKHGENETVRILASIEDKRSREVISRREKEILLTLPWEKTNKEISSELDICEKTVKNHFCKIYRKLGVKNRIQLFRHLSSP